MPNVGLKGAMKMENARTENSADFLAGDGKPDLLLINLRTIGTHHCDQTVGEEAAQEIERLRAEVEASASRAERLEKALCAYQAAVNKIDDLIEYSLPMPPETKAALYAVLANLTATLAKEITND